MLIVAVPGRLVRDPDTRRVVDENPIEIDETNPAWARLLADGDVAAAPAPKAPATPAPAADKEIKA